MKNRLESALTTTFVLGIVISFSSLLFLYFFFQFSQIDALFAICILWAGVLAQTGGFVGARFIPRTRFWPAVLMILSAAVVVWAGIAGPATFYGYPATFMRDMREGLITSPMYLALIPLPLVGCGVGLAYLVVGILYLLRDFRALAAEKAALAGEARDEKAPPAEEIPPEEDASKLDEAILAADQTEDTEKAAGDAPPAEAEADAPEGEAAGEEADPAEENAAAEAAAPDESGEAEAPTQAVADHGEGDEEESGGGEEIAEVGAEEECPAPPVATADEEALEAGIEPVSTDEPSEPKEEEIGTEVPSADADDESPEGEDAPEDKESTPDDSPGQATGLPLPPAGQKERHVNLSDEFDQLDQTAAQMISDSLPHPSRKKKGRSRKKKAQAQRQQENSAEAPNSEDAGSASGPAKA